MKFLILTLGVLASFSSFAGDGMTDQEKAEFMNKVALETRADYWKRGFDSVSSRTMAYSKSDIDNYVKAENNKRYHEPLEADEIADLYRCHYEPRCELYLIRVSGSYYSGWSEYSHFIFLNTNEPEYDYFAHLVYGE